MFVRYSNVSSGLFLHRTYFDNIVAIDSLLEHIMVSTRTFLVLFSSCHGSVYLLYLVTCWAKQLALCCTHAVDNVAQHFYIFTHRGGDVKLNITAART